jgi:hypothetical protein
MSSSASSFVPPKGLPALVSDVYSEGGNSDTWAPPLFLLIKLI